MPRERSDPDLTPRGWPENIGRTVAIDETGLVLGAGTRLARLTKDGRLAVEDDSERILALLSVAGRRPVSSEVFGPIEAAAFHWRRGDRALANFRLVFATLPRLDDPADAWRLRLAEAFLDEGLSPRILMAELGFDPSALDLGKAGYNANQARVPAGNGRDSGRWDAFWHGVVAWLEQPVPEYDTDTGTEVGTRPRGQAIATNPITVGIAGTAALLGGEVLLPAAAAVPEAASPEVADFASNVARGLASEARVLQDLGLTKNTHAVVTEEGRSIPDALTDFLSVEIKDQAYVSRTRQVRIQTDAARISGRQSLLVIGEKTRLTESARRAFYEIIRRADLGPH